MERNSELLYLSVITVAEVESGIAKARREGSARRAELLGAWLETVLHLYAVRILPLTIDVARRLGELTDRARGFGRAPGLADLAIAATALDRSYMVLTRNVRHFEGLGVRVHDPFASLPATAANP